MSFPAIFIIVIVILVSLVLMNNHVRMNNTFKRFLNAMILVATVIWLADDLGFMDVF